jgi:hypothetical protein
MTVTVIAINQKKRKLKRRAKNGNLPQKAVRRNQRKRTKMSRKRIRKRRRKRRRKKKVVMKKVKKRSNSQLRQNEDLVHHHR